MVFMLAISFFTWWYGRGWAGIIHNFPVRLRRIADSFSASQLLRTLFAPWRRIITYPGASLQEKWRAWGDNLVSRVIGFIVRFFVLLAAGLILLASSLALLLEIILWPLLPLLIPGLIVLGVVS